MNFFSFHIYIFLIFVFLVISLLHILQHSPPAAAFATNIFIANFAECWDNATECDWLHKISSRDKDLKFFSDSI